MGIDQTRHEDRITMIHFFARRVLGEILPSTNGRNLVSFDNDRAIRDWPAADRQDDASAKDQS